MLNRALKILLISVFTATTVVQPASAQFGGFKRVLRAPTKILRAPAKILPVPGAGALLPLAVIGGPFRGVFGVVAAVAIGTIIFQKLTKTERVEVARRAKVVVAKDPDQRVQDVYTSKDGSKQVTIVAEPMQKASDLKNDPSIQLAADKMVAPGEAKPAGGTDVASSSTGATDIIVPPQAQAPAATGPSSTTTASAGTKPADDPKAKAAPKDEEVVRISEIPPETQCRKVITELEIKKKKGEAEKESNTAIFCQMTPGDWKPASA